MRKFLAFLISLLVAGISTAHAEIILNRKISSGEMKIRNLILLPPTAYKPRKFDATELKQIVIRNPLSTKVREREEERDETLGRRIGDFIPDVLRKSGWQINDSDFSSQSLQGNIKMSTLVDSLLATHEVLVRQIRRRPKDIKKGRYSLGKDIANLNLPSDTDAVAFVYGSQTIYGRGEGKWIDLYISFADAQTGEILCYFHTTGPLKEKELLKDLKLVPHP
jgi:hypothetical protein